MSVVLELDALLPLCNQDPEAADTVIEACCRLLQANQLSLSDRLLKLADAYKHVNNFIKQKLLKQLPFEAINANNSNNNLTVGSRNELIKRLILIWECDDVYTRALACCLYSRLHHPLLMSEEIWYRLRLSVLSSAKVEWTAAIDCVKVFQSHLDDPRFDELMADALNSKSTK